MQISTHVQQHKHLSLQPIATNYSYINTHTTTHPYDSAWQAALSLTSTYGYSSIASFALDPKKQLFFSSNGKAFISYVLLRDVALAIGDPIGPTQELPLVLTEFLALWHARHKAVAFWQAREELLDLYRDQGLHALKIGEDTIIDVQNFTLKGGKMANIRTSARRAEKVGVHVIFYEGAAIPDAQREQMAHISQAWLTRKGGCEMGFSMGRFGPDTETAQLTALAFDQQGTMQAFLTFLPIDGRNGWSLDLMRRDKQTIPGTMELLIARSLEYCKTRGKTMVSLGLAPLNNHNQNQVSPLGKCCSLLLRRSGKLQQFQSLIAFKQKFQPSWENRYLIFSHRLNLLQIGLALNVVHHQ